MHAYRKLIHLVPLLALAAVLPALAERGEDSQRVSKNGRAEGTIGGVSCTVEYGRPLVKGRQLWGGLVPYGEVWRTGANEATTIQFSADVKVEGSPLPAGTYSLFTIPGESEWVVIFNRTAEQWGAFKYDAAQDALRVVVKPQPAEATEELTFTVGDSGIVLRWGELALPVAITPAG